MLKTNALTELFYWKWRTEFYKAVKPHDMYFYLDFLHRPILKKLDKALFFQTLETEILPSYNFWTGVQKTLMNLPYAIRPDTLEEDLKRFANSEEHYLRKHLFVVLLCFKNFPVVFRDLYKFYPKFNLKFDEIEFVFLDYWSQTPKVIASL